MKFNVSECECTITCTRTILYCLREWNRKPNIFLCRYVRQMNRDSKCHCIQTYIIVQKLFYIIGESISIHTNIITLLFAYYTWMTVYHINSTPTDNQFWMSTNGNALESTIDTDRSPCLSDSNTNIELNRTPYGVEAKTDVSHLTNVNFVFGYDRHEWIEPHTHKADRSHS